MAGVGLFNCQLGVKGSAAGDVPRGNRGEGVHMGRGWWGVEFGGAWVWGCLGFGVGWFAVIGWCSVTGSLL